MQETRDEGFHPCMATHSSILACRIPWTEEPGGLQFMGSQSQTGQKRLSTNAHVGEDDTFAVKGS